MRFNDLHKEKYLKKALNEKERKMFKKLLAKLTAPKLKFAYKGSRIVQVYKHGPKSCMTGSNRVRAYEGPDLALAYVTQMGNVVARSIVWPKKKLYTRTYGKHKLIRELLEKQGYKHQRHFTGARIKKIKQFWGGGYVVPSLDCAKFGWQVKGDHLVIN